MTHIALTHTEVDLLLRVLRELESELHTEIVHTDRKEFRDHLKENRAVIHEIVAKLQQLPQDEMEQNAKSPA